MKKYKVAVFDYKTRKEIIMHAYYLGYTCECEYIFHERKSTFLCFNDTTITDMVDLDWFIKDKEYETLYPEQFLRLTKKDVKIKKFDIKPFDPVLVRDFDTVWSVDFFSHRVDGFYICAGYSSWSYIAKYKEEIKQYIGTKLDITESFGPDEQA